MTKVKRKWETRWILLEEFDKVVKDSIRKESKIATTPEYDFYKIEFTVLFKKRLYCNIREPKFKEVL